MFYKQSVKTGIKTAHSWQGFYMCIAGMLGKVPLEVSAKITENIQKEYTWWKGA